MAEEEEEEAVPQQPAVLAALVVELRSGVGLTLARLRSFARRHVIDVTIFFRRQD